MTCQQEYKHRWYQANKARLRARHAANLIAWRKANPDKVHAQRKRQWAKHGKKRSAATKLWRVKNHARVLATHARWVENNRELVRLWGRRHYAQNRARIKRRVTEYNRSHSNQHRAWQTTSRHARRQCLAPTYLKWELKKRNVPVTPDNLETAKLQIRLWRTRHLFKAMATGAVLNR